MQFLYAERRWLLCWTGQYPRCYARHPSQHPVKIRTIWGDVPYDCVSSVLNYRRNILFPAHRLLILPNFQFNQIIKLYRLVVRLSCGLPRIDNCLIYATLQYIFSKPHYDWVFVLRLISCFFPNHLFRFFIL